MSSLEALARRLQEPGVDVGQAVADLTAAIALANDELFVEWMPPILRSLARHGTAPSEDALGAWAERLAGLADDADQPTRAWSLALRVRPTSEPLLGALARAVVEEDYGCEGAFADVGAHDPQNAAVWRAREEIARFHVSAGTEPRDTALLWLAEALRSADQIERAKAAAGELQALAPGWRAPTAEEWALLADLL